MRPKIAVTNYNKAGKVTDEWHVRIGDQWIVFSQEDWEAGGIQWIEQHLGVR